MAATVTCHHHHGRLPTSPIIRDFNPTPLSQPITDIISEIPPSCPPLHHRHPFCRHHHHQSHPLRGVLILSPLFFCHCQYYHCHPCGRVGDQDPLHPRAVASRVLGEVRPEAVASRVLGDFLACSVGVPWEPGKPQSVPDSEREAVTPVPPAHSPKSILLNRQRGSPLPTEQGMER